MPVNSGYQGVVKATKGYKRLGPKLKMSYSTLLAVSAKLQPSQYLDTLKSKKTLFPLLYNLIKLKSPTSIS